MKETIPTVFYVSKDFKTNIMSEQTLYRLKYLSEDTFREDELYEADGQDNYIAMAGRPVFGTVEVDSAHCTNCAEAKITKGNLNSGEKCHKIEKLKNACARSQRMEDWILK